MLVHVIVIVIPCKIRSLENLCIESENYNMWYHSRVKALSHSEWMVPSSNPCEGRNYFYSRVGNGGLRLTRIDGYVVAMNKSFGKKPRIFSTGLETGCKPVLLSLS